MMRPMNLLPHRVDGATASGRSAPDARKNGASHHQSDTGPTPLGAGLWAALHIGALVVLLAFAAEKVRAEDNGDAASLAAERFAENCFSPFMTAALASERIAAPGLRVDFYDLRPFRASNSISPVIGRAATPGTDRRCEIAFDGADVETGVGGVLAGLVSEGIATEAVVPEDFPALNGTEFIAARQLNPSRIAVVQVGTRPGPNGTETFINVERLEPLDQN